MYPAKLRQSRGLMLFMTQWGFFLPEYQVNSLNPEKISTSAIKILDNHLGLLMLSSAKATSMSRAGRLIIKCSGSYKGFTNSENKKAEITGNPAHKSRKINLCLSRSGDWNMFLFFHSNQRTTNP